MGEEIAPDSEGIGNSDAGFADAWRPRRDGDFLLKRAPCRNLALIDDCGGRAGASDALIGLILSLGINPDLGDGNPNVLAQGLSAKCRRLFRGCFQCLLDGAAGRDEAAENCE